MSEHILRKLNTDIENFDELDSQEVDSQENSKRLKCKTYFYRYVFIYLDLDIEIDCYIQIFHYVYET